MGLTGALKGSTFPLPFELLPVPALMVDDRAKRNNRSASRRKCGTREALDNPVAVPLSSRTSPHLLGKVRCRFFYKISTFASSRLILASSSSIGGRCVLSISSNFSRLRHFHPVRQL